MTTCRAKDPSTCSYHGTNTPRTIQEAIRERDFNAYVAANETAEDDIDSGRYLLSTTDTLDMDDIISSGDSFEREMLLQNPHVDADRLRTIISTWNLLPNGLAKVKDHPNYEPGMLP